MAHICIVHGNVTWLDFERRRIQENTRKNVTIGKTSPIVEGPSCALARERIGTHFYLCCSDRFPRTGRLTGMTSSMVESPSCALARERIETHFYLCRFDRFPRTGRLTGVTYNRSLNGKYKQERHIQEQLVKSRDCQPDQTPRLIFNKKFPKRKFQEKPNSWVESPARQSRNFKAEVADCRDSKPQEKKQALEFAAAAGLVASEGRDLDVTSRIASQQQSERLFFVSRQGVPASSERPLGIDDLHRLEKIIRTSLSRFLFYVDMPPVCGKKIFSENSPHTGVMSTYKRNKTKNFSSLQAILNFCVNKQVKNFLTHESSCHRVDKVTDSPQTANLVDGQLRKSKNHATRIVTGSFEAAVVHDPGIMLRNKHKQVQRKNRNGLKCLDITRLKIENFKIFYFYNLVGLNALNLHKVHGPWIHHFAGQIVENRDKSRRLSLNFQTKNIFKIPENIYAKNFTGKSPWPKISKKNSSENLPRYKHSQPFPDFKHFYFKNREKNL